MQKLSKAHKSPPIAKSEVKKSKNHHFMVFLRVLDRKKVILGPFWVLSWTLDEYVGLLAVDYTCESLRKPIKAHKSQNRK